MSQTPDSAERPRFRARVYGYPAATATGYGWSYELLDTHKPAGHQIVMLGCRWTWRQALADALGDLASREFRDARAKIAELEELGRTIHRTAGHTDYGDGRWEMARRILDVLHGD